jgi:hypothetical protein
MVGLPPGQAGPVPGNPLTATAAYRLTQILANATRMNYSDTSLFHRDEQGRMRTESRGR